MSSHDKKGTKKFGFSTPMMWNMMSHTEFQIEWTRGRPFFIKVDAAFVLNVKGEDGDTFSRRLQHKKSMLL